MARDQDHEHYTKSLFDVEDVDTMPHVRDMTVSYVGSQDVREFARRYHYTGLGGNASWRWGLWHGAVLHGVIAYNLPTREACAAVFGPEQLHRVWHMGRLAMSEDSPPNSESRLIGGSLRAIHQTRPDIWAVLTYADTTAGHLGYVYQATNALYTGTGGSTRYFLDRQGQMHGTRTASTSVEVERVKELGWTLHSDGGVKHRYVYVLGSKRERRRRQALLKFAVLPYPKLLHDGRAQNDNGDGTHR